MTYVKSLRHNLDYGIDIPSHRTHRSRKGKERGHRETSFATILYKKKKKEYKYLQLDIEELYN